MASVEELIAAAKAQQSPAISAMEGLARGYLGGQQQALERAKTLIMLEQNRREQEMKMREHEMMVKNQERLSAQLAAQQDADRHQQLKGAGAKPEPFQPQQKIIRTIESNEKGQLSEKIQFSPMDEKASANEVQYAIDKNGQAYDVFTGEPISQRASGVSYKHVSMSSAGGQNGANGLKTLPPSSIFALNEGKTVARLLPDVEAAIQKNEGKFGPITGRVRSANPYDVDAQTFDARMRSASQSFGKFMESGVLRKEDEEKYRKMFPQASDDDQVKKNKLEIIKRQLAQKYEDDRKTLGRSGYDVSGFETLDIAPSIFNDSSGGAGEPNQNTGIFLTGNAAQRLAELRSKKASGTLR